MTIGMDERDHLPPGDDTVPIEVEELEVARMARLSTDEAEQHR